MPFDIGSGLDWEAYDTAKAIEGKYGRIAGYFDYKRKFQQSANEHLKAERKYLRDVLRRYGFGRFELTPVRNCEAISRYMAKALTAPRKPEDKGIRRVACMHGARRATQRWASNGAWGWVWRHKLAMWADRNGFADEDAIKAAHGSHWAWSLRGEVMGMELPDDTAYPSRRHHEIAERTARTVSKEAVTKVMKMVSG